MGSLLVYFAVFTGIALGGMWHLQWWFSTSDPSPRHLLMGFICFLIWLALLLTLFGRAVFGRSSRMWHWLVFCFIGPLIGVFGGLEIAFIFGGVIGATCGFLIGLAVFVDRHIFWRGPALPFNRQ
jgi:hypothetical protein